MVVNMRWLFLIVLSLNLAYIAWQTLKPDEDLYAYVAPLKNVQPIVLLRELPPQQAQVIDSASQQQETVEKVNAGSLAVAKNKTIEPEKVEPVSEVVAEEIAAEIKPVVADITEKLALDAVKAGSIASSVRPIAESMCYTLGPFRNLDELRGFTREIKSHVVEADFRGKEEKEQSLFWVYVQPETSKRKAIATGKRLKEKKIKDFYLIREGEKIHGISLGHFRNKSGAYGLAKKVQKLGFDVQVEPVFKTYTVYWLDYQLASGASIPQSVFDNQIKVGQKDKVSLLSRDCQH